MDSSSSAPKASCRVAPTQSSIWLTRLAPMSALVTIGLRRTHASAIWASDWPRARATSFSRLALATTSCVMLAGRRNLGSWPARILVGASG